MKPVGRPPKPEHKFQRVKSITRSKLYAGKGYLDYYSSNLRTEFNLADIVSIECDCEEMIVTIKSTQVTSHFKRKVLR
jgi:hypothetical protein